MNGPVFIAVLSTHSNSILRIIPAGTVFLYPIVSSPVTPPKSIMHLCNSESSPIINYIHSTFSTFSYYSIYLSIIILLILIIVLKS